MVTDATNVNSQTWTRYRQKFNNKFNKLISREYFL